ncbi:Regulator of RNase E activity RraA [Meinhardsimonia xiamenensis]|jgi:4-hydroxy-4-methyl-2-oxoglutarate aldolase|uniref:Putative 4-hydroxy-4-methyl-2-oxoglutarate aldolase n=1 Tax=Meinhardsimonia xiamenensis TaxID=990712 RepID=A0A1G8Z9L1_9RHOB|nr:aldolase [Meinhardsimonia xiamenensis]PRX37612.1 regulator of RNase E activity RraA [Meinhardsimonia xiamenensis]SDK11786.1 Regulator of RNase E activity RraA [Meinhardsimonia xiamenensis]
MIEEPPKLTIRRPARRPSAEQIAAFRDVPTSFVVDAMKGAGALDQAIRPLEHGGRLPGHVAGPALTAANGPADILATLAALAFLREGDVLVAGASGYAGCAAAGDKLAAMARNAGAAAIVTDGPMRDLEGIVATGLPAWCTGLTPASPYSTGPGRVGLPMQIGGQRVDTGDMIVADSDGVVVVPYERIDEVIEGIARVRAAEAALDAEIAGGMAVPPDIIDLLASEAVEYVD